MAPQDYLVQCYHSSAQSLHYLVDVVRDQDTSVEVFPLQSFRLGVVLLSHLNVQEGYHLCKVPKQLSQEGQFRYLLDKHVETQPAKVGHKRMGTGARLDKIGDVLLDDLSNFALMLVSSLGLLQLKSVCPNAGLKVLHNQSVHVCTQLLCLFYELY